MIKDELIEALAEIEHERWADWQQYVHDQSCQIFWEFPAGVHTAGGTVIPPALVQRWETQIATPYAELSEAEKQSDRDQVMRYWPLIVGAFADWLQKQSYDFHYGFTGDSIRLLVKRWCEEMTA